MDELTTSEKGFIAYCEARGLTPIRIERTLHKTPDFELQLGDVSAAIEVKELCPNDLDKATWQKVRTIGTAAEYCSAADRVREKILQACKQLKRRTQ